MHYKNWKLPAIVFVSLFIIGCGDSNSSENNDVQIQSYLDIAEVYRGQGQFRASIIEAQNALQLDEQNVETRLFVATVFMDFGDFTSARDILNIAQELDPDSIEVKLALSESLLQSRLFDEGYALISNLNTETPEQENNKNWLIGSFHAGKGDSEASATAFESVLQADPLHLKTLMALARLKYLTGEEEEAVALTNRAIEADARGENVDLWIWRGQLATFQEDWPTAEEGFFEALDMMSLYDTMTAKRFTTLQSILVPLRNQQKNSEALRYSEIISNSPQGQLLSSFSNALSLFQSGDMLEAESALSDTLELAPNHPGGNILLGLSRYQQGDFAEAERLLTEFVDVGSASSEMVTTLADTFLKNNNIAGALTLLEEALANEPQNTSYLGMIGIIKQSQGDTDGAMASLQSALSITPDSPEVLYTLGALQVQTGDITSALENISRSLEINPEFEAAKTALLEIYLGQNDLNTANDLSEQWLAQDADSVFNNMAAGTLAAQSENFIDARNYFNRVSELDNTNLAAKLNLSRIEMIETNYSAAENIYLEILEIQPLNTNALGGLLALGDLNDSSDEKISMIQEVISSNPEQALPSIILGQYYLVSGDLDSASALAESAYAIEESNLTLNFLVEISIQRSVLASGNEEDEVALNFANQALELNNNSPRALRLAATIESRLGNLIRARDLVSQLIEIQPNDASALELEGDIIVSSNDSTGAMASYLKAWDLQATTPLGLKIYQVYSILEDAPAMESFLTSWTQIQTEEITPKLLLAMELQGAGRNDEAIDLYEQLYAVQEENVVVLNNMAWLYQDSNPSRSLELASSAASLYPENADVLDTYGWILLQQDNQQQAIEVLERAAALSPDSEEIQEHLDAARQN